MGRFDALNQLDEVKQEVKPKPPASPSPTSKKTDASRIVEELKRPADDLKGSAFFEQARQEKQSAYSQKPANPQTRKAVIHSPVTDPFEKAEKYTTRLQPRLVKKLKLEAIEKDINDYDV